MSTSPMSSASAPTASTAHSAAEMLHRLATIPDGDRVVLIPDLVEAPAILEREVLGPDVHILTPQAHRDAEIPDAVWQRADAVFAWHHLEYPARVLDKMTRLKVFVRVGVGYDNVDIAHAGRLGIPVCNIPDYGTEDVADHAMALLLGLARGIPAFDSAVRAGNAHWSYQAAGPLKRLSGAVLGIIGLGRIGIATAMRAKAFGMDVRFYDPYRADGYDKAIGVTRAETLDELLAVSDMLSFHTPLTSETTGMANAGFFANVKPGVIVINTARGPIIDLAALYDAMRDGRVGAAGLDVLPQEPPRENEPLIAQWRAGEPWIRHRLVVTPHSAFFCDRSFFELRTKSARCALQVFQGGPPRNCINAQHMITRRAI